MPTVLGLVLFTAIAAGLYGARQWQRNSDRRALAGRIALSDDSIYSNYYADSGYDRATVLELWAEIAVTLRVPPGKLRPTDRFGKDIGSSLITSDELDTLYERARRRAQQLGIQIDFAKISTVDQYVRALGQQPSTSPAAS
jgi:hypothetical protein